MSHTAGSQSGNALRIAAWSLGAALLLLPLLAMQFTSEVAWSAGDFLAAALLLGGLGLSLEVTMRFVNDTRARILVGLAVLAAFFLVWAELAVGLLH